MPHVRAGGRVLGLSGKWGHGLVVHPLAPLLFLAAAIPFYFFWLCPR
jgi:hypothetical protein